MNLPSKVIDIERLYQKIGEIEAIKNYDKVKLERDQVKTRISELELQVQDYLQIKKERDEAQKKLTNLNDKAVEFVKTILTEIPKPKGQRNYSPEITATGLHSIIEYLIEEQVSQQVRAASSDKLVNAFREEVQKQVQELLNSRPAFFSQRPEKAMALKRTQYEDPYVVFKKTWEFPCRKCHLDHSLDLRTIGAIREFLDLRYVDIPIDFFSSGLVGEHSLHVTLADVVRSYLRNSTDELPQAPT